MVRVFNAASGVLLWDGVTYPSPVVPQSDAQKGLVAAATQFTSSDAVLVESEEKFAVLGDNSVYSVDCRSGETMWSWSPDEENESVGSSENEKAVVHQLHSSGGQIYAIGQVDHGKLFVSSIDAKSGESKPKTLSQDSKFTPGTIIDSALVSLSKDGSTVLVWDLKSDKQTEVAVSSLGGGSKAVTLASISGGEVPAAILSFSDEHQVVVALDGSGLKKVKEFTQGKRTFGAASPQAGWAAENQKQVVASVTIGPAEATIEVFDISGGGEIFSTVRVPITAADHGDATALFPHLFTRKDDTLGARMLLTSADHAVAMLQAGKVGKAGPLLWVREEALGSVTQCVFVDKKRRVLGGADTGMPGVAERLGLQAAQLAGIATGLFGTVQDLISKAQAGEFESILEGKGGGYVEESARDNKIALLMTAPGKLFAIDSESNELLWSVLFDSNLHMFVAKDKPEMGSSAEVLLISNTKYGSKSNAPAAKWIDSSSGATLKEGSLPEGVWQMMVLPADTTAAGATADGDGDKPSQTLLLLDKEKKVHLLPDTAASHASFEKQRKSLTFHVMEQSAGSATLQGYQLGEQTDGNGYSASPQWSVVFPKDETVITVAKHPHEAVNSPVKILGDDSLLLKYLNPHLLAVATLIHEEVAKGPAADVGSTSDDSGDTSDTSGIVHIGGQSAQPQATKGSQIVVYLIDTITGRIIHRVLHPQASGPVYLVQTENWVVYSYWNQKARRSEMGSVCLYEQAVEKYGLNPWTKPDFTDTFSSFASPTPVVHHRSFIFPLAVKALATSETVYGITTKHVIVGLTTNQIYSMDLRFMDPRRPSGKPTPTQMAEGLMQYSPYLPLIPQQIVSFNATVANLHTITSTPSAVESTSLVMAYGE